MKGLEIVHMIRRESHMIRGELINHLEHISLYKDESVDLSLTITKTQLIMALMTLITKKPAKFN
jgi:hypothetical protein